MTRTARYDLARPARVAHAQMLQLPVQPVGQRLEGIEPAEGGLRFVNAAWLEVWQDSGTTLSLRRAALEVRRLS